MFLRDLTNNLSLRLLYYQYSSGKIVNLDPDLEVIWSLENSGTLVLVFFTNIFFCNIKTFSKSK